MKRKTTFDQIPIGGLFRFDYGEAVSPMAKKTAAAAYVFPTKAVPWRGKREVLQTSANALSTEEITVTRYVPPAMTDLLPVLLIPSALDLLRARRAKLGPRRIKKSA